MIKPARGYVLIEPLEADEVSAGGVILPDRVKDMPQKGKVLAVGESIMNPGFFSYTTDYVGPRYTGEGPCAVGDTIIFKKFVDQRIKENGKELLFIPFQDIIGIYEKD